MDVSPPDFYVVVSVWSRLLVPEAQCVSCVARDNHQSEKEARRGGDCWGKDPEFEVAFVYIKFDIASKCVLISLSMVASIFTQQGPMREVLE